MATYQPTQKLSKRQRDQMILANKGLVFKVANRWVKKCSIPLDELEQIGFIGLVKAVDNFDDSTGNQFSTFAIPKITGEIMHYLRDKNSLIRIPQAAFTTMGKVRVLIKKAGLAGRVITEIEAIEALGIPLEQYQWAKRAEAGVRVSELDELLEPECEEQELSGWTVVIEQIARLPRVKREAVILYSVGRISGCEQVDLAMSALGELREQCSNYN